MPSLILSNPLDSDDAQAIGLNIRDYAVGEIITVNDFAAVTLIRTGYAVAYGTGQDVLLTGGGPPTDATGTDGQWYLDTQAEVLWGPKTGGYWPNNPIRPDRGVARFAIDGNGHLQVTYSTGTTVDLGNIRGPSANINVKDYGAVGDGFADDTAAVTAAVAGLPEGAELYFPWGTKCKVLAPIVLPRNRGIRMGQAPRWAYDTGVSTALLAGGGFVGDAVLRLKDEEELTGSVTAIPAGTTMTAGPGDSSGQWLTRVVIDGGYIAGSIDGIKASGLVRSIRLADVTVRQCTGSGVHTVGYVRKDGKTYYPRGWALNNVTADRSGNMGFAFNLLNDSTLVDCLAVANATHGFYFAGPGELLLVGCRSVYNKGGRGFYLTGSSYGNTVLSACSTDRNEQSGIYIDCTGKQPIILSGCALRRDGRNGNTGGAGYAGLYVSGATAPVIVTGLVTETGVDDDGTGSSSPQNGLRVENSSNVVIESGMLWGQTTAALDGGGNVLLRIGPAVLRATGASATPTIVGGGELTLANWPGRALFAKSTSGADHVATIYQAATTGVDVASALNVTSDNPQSSAMYLSGTETNRGTLKIAHRGYADGSDSGAAALSMDIQTTGSAARGMYLWSTQGGTTGDAITVRVSASISTIAREDFVVKASGKCGIGIPLAATPSAALDVRTTDVTTPNISALALANGTDIQQWKRASDGAVRTRITNAAQLSTSENIYANGPGLQVGGTSNTFGGGSGVLGLTNAATVPNANPVGGVVVYAEGGLLKWRDPNGVIYVLNNTGGGGGGSTGPSSDVGTVTVLGADGSVPFEVDVTGHWGITDNLANLVPNPQVAATTTSWFGNGGTGATVTVTRPTTGGPAGGLGAFYRQTYTVANTTAAAADPLASVVVDGRAAAALPIPVTAGQVYSASLWTQSSIAQRLDCRIQWYDAAGTLLGTAAGTPVTVTAATWTQLTSANATAPAGALYARVAVSTSAGAGAVPFPIGATLDVTMAQLEANATVHDFFDGTSNGGTWTGAANATSSTKPAQTYYDPAGAVTAEAGMLVPDPDGNGFSVFRPGGPWTSEDQRVANFINQAAGAGQAASAVRTALEARYAVNWGTGTAFPTGVTLKPGDTYLRTDVGTNGMVFQFTGNTANGSAGWIAEGVVICTSTTRPAAALYATLQIFETDTGRSWQWTGTAWALLTGGPGLRVAKAGTQAVAAATWVPLSWDTPASVPVNGTGMFAAANPTRLTAPVPGRYRAAATSGGCAQIALRLNSAGYPGTPTAGTMLASLNFGASNGAANVTADEVVLAAGDYVEAYVQNSAATSSGTVSGYVAAFSLSFVGS